MDEYELAQELSKRSKLSMDTAIEIVRVFFDTIAEGMLSGEVVHIEKFANLYPNGELRMRKNWLSYRLRVERGW